MSWVEDARTLLQDFVAPELRGINQWLDDLILSMQKSFADVERLATERHAAAELVAMERDKVGTERMAAMERLAAERHRALVERMESLQRELLLAVDLALARRRIEDLERQQPPPSGRSQPSLGTGS
jgi:hypothetical protein